MKTRISDRLNHWEAADQYFTTKTRDRSTLLA
jgi:hypothetical protein